MNSTEAVSEEMALLVREHVVDEVDDVIHGVTFDGRRLVLAAGYRLFRLMPDSGRAVDQLETFPERGGLACDRKHLWQHSEGRLQQLNPRTGLGPELWSSTAGELRRIDGASGRVVSRLALPADIEVCDLAGDGEGRVWCVDGRSRVLRAFVKARTA
jgi:hypothetical protein